MEFPKKMAEYKAFFISIIFILKFTFFIYPDTFGKTISTQNISDEITDTTYSCVVTTNAGSVYKDVNISGLADSSIMIFNKQFVREIKIEEIQSIKFNRRGFWTGAAIGAGVAFGIGLLGGNGFSTGDGQQEYSLGNVVIIGTILAVPLGLIGGGLGVLFAGDHLYILSNSNFYEKRKKIKFLIKEYSDR